ncbi:tetratricopeptide repeat protein [Canibacter zhoujuaniae]|uniref:tetratricopeptide repeat protein n=1 Tax=Canibacter zhoujuaniae TaxID=2708343 RepID=UPI0014224B5D|nr:tetratricopeptide repeat protein [Canibacter zhoujuaniae]
MLGETFNLNYSGTDLAVPLSLIRTLILELDDLVGANWQNSPLSRAVFHRAGREGENLSDRQTPDDQLRYYTSERVFRGLRQIAYDYASRLDKNIVLRLPSFPADPDTRFVEWLGAKGKFKVEISFELEANELKYDQQSSKFYSVITSIKDGTLTSNDLSKYLNLLLSYGDSWTAKLIADVYLSVVSEIETALADALGITYALQGDTGMAKLIWEKWLTASAIDEARARYSLAMLQARHNPRALLDPVGAAENLNRAWSRLKGLPITPQTTYESVFNRNGMALLLFRQGKYAEAKAVLEAGIASLQGSGYAEKLHHTVLTSNLARVIASMGDFRKAEWLFREAIAMDPLFAEYHQDLASFLSDMGRFEEAAEEARRTIEIDPSMPEAYRLLGFILMQLGDPLRARDEYAKAANIGDDMAVLDMLRASYEADTPEWTIQFRDRVAQAQLDVKSRAEAELLLAQARSALDPSLDVYVELKHLQTRFPNDELIGEALVLNKAE